MIGHSRIAAGALALALLVAIPVGCDDEEEPSGGSPERFDLALDFSINPDHAGIYTALEEGYFDEAGLDVRPQVPSDPSAPIKQVAAGQVDLAISYEPEVMLARDQGLDVVAVGALVHGPLTSLISLPEAGIDEPADLAGKTVVTAGIPYQSAYLETILRDAGVDSGSVEEVAVGFNLLQPLLAGRADAMLGGFLNVEGVDLAERGENPRVVPVDRLGIPTYDELVLVADGDRLREDPEPIRAFLAALERGTLAAAGDPDAATEALLAVDDALEPELTRAEVDATLPRLLPPRLPTPVGEEQAGPPFGYMDPAEWRRFGAFLAEEEQIDAAPPPGDLLTNELLPQG